MADKLTRRQFIRDSAVVGAAIGAGIALSDSARFIGISSHDRPDLKKIIEKRG